MCGIAGIIATQAERYEPAVGRMIAALRHRGPDGSGFHAFGNCALGHVRLSIIDLQGSTQPMLSADRKLGLVFNGEIYGYKAVRQAQADYAFQTNGDTEVLLALYRRYGRQMLEHLPGMFSFAIWDEQAQALFCARDRFGEKPFYYAWGKNGEFIFASEIKAILATGLVEPVLDRESVAEYLRRLYVPPTRCIYRNIHCLPPAHSLWMTQGKASQARYWQLPPPKTEITLSAAVEQFAALLDQSMARQLVADVPVGTFLSGGLDSSTLVALAAKRHPHCKTFSFGFGESINELPYAREIAARYQTDHLELSDEQQTISGLLRQMAAVYDEPLGDSSNIPVFLISKLARQHVTVALAGEGGDELAAGYAFWYRSLFSIEQASQLNSLQRGMLRLAGGVTRRLGISLPLWLDQLYGGMIQSMAGRDLLSWHEDQVRVFSETELSSLGFVAAKNTKPNPAGLGSVDDVLRHDVLNYLPGDILVKTDRASMANSLEIRAPFLDVDFASFCLSLPVRLKMDRTRDKVILREAFGEAWSPAIRRRSKQGFGAPVRDWLKRPDVESLRHELLDDPSQPLYSMVPFAAAQPFAKAGDYKTWSLLVLALWAKHWPAK